jgi:carboxyl-terminal processing protease
MDQFLLFDYVTQYCQDKDSIPPVEDFRFTDWDKFKQFLKDRNFSYQTNTEKELKEMMAAMEKEGIEISTSLKELETQIQADKEDDLEENKQVIIDLLEKDIASRYYYQKGKIQIGLRNDREIKEAVSLINDPERYGEILNPQN